MTTKLQSAKRGPEPERVTIEGMYWADAVAIALQKPAPKKAVKSAKAPKSKEK